MQWFSVYFSQNCRFKRILRHIMKMILQGTKMVTLNNKGLWLKKKVEVLRKVCTALKDVLCLYAYVMFICICIFSTFRSGMLYYKVFHQNYNYITMSGRKIRSLYKLFLLCKFSLLNNLHIVLESNLLSALILHDAN